MEPMKPMKPMKPMAPLEPIKPMDQMSSPAASWWPESLSGPSSVGAQDGLRYAFFPDQHTLVIDRDGAVEQYDTGKHCIQSVAQSGGTRGTMFISQLGEVDLASLPKVEAST